MGLLCLILGSVLPMLDFRYFEKSRTSISGVSGGHSKPFVKFPGRGLLSVSQDKSAVGCRLVFQPLPPWTAEADNGTTLPFTPSSVQSAHIAFFFSSFAIEILKNLVFETQLTISFTVGAALVEVVGRMPDPRAQDLAKTLHLQHRQLSVNKAHSV